MKIASIAAALILALTTAQAQLVLSSSGGENLSVGPGTAGFGFTAAAPLTVRALGVFDSDLISPGLYSAHSVGIWDAATHALLASTLVPAQGAVAIGSFWYANIAPLTLQAGHSYVIGASYADSDFDFARGNIASVTTAAGITMGNALLSTGSTFGFPDLAVPGANKGFLGPNASFAVVPEPKIYALIFAFGLFSFIILRRRGH